LDANANAMPCNYEYQNYHMESASTAISAFFKYPVSNTNTL
jgi:hypothetical protein